MDTRGILCILNIFLICNNIERSSYNFFMNIRNIESDESERHKDYADHNGIEYDDDTKIRKSEMEDLEFVKYLNDEYDETHRSQKKTHVSYELEWKEGEWCQVIDREF